MCVPDHTGSTFITSHTKKTQPTMTLSSAALSPSLPHKETSLLPTAGLIFHSHTNETWRTIRAGNTSYQNFQVIHTESARSPSPPEETEDLWRSKTSNSATKGSMRKPCNAFWLAEVIILLTPPENLLLLGIKEETMASFPRTDRHPVTVH